MQWVLPLTAESLRASLLRASISDRPMGFPGTVYLAPARTFFG